jgi:hypothetical protein
MPDPGPLGLTFLVAMTRAMVRASLVNNPSGGEVETVFTSCDQRFFGFLPLVFAMIVSSRALGQSRDLLI